jgi:hypothetical protein
MTTHSSAAAIREQWKEANMLFARIGLGEIKRAIRLARQGKTHPDPRIAYQAIQWARSVSSIERRTAQLDSNGWLRFRALVIELASLGTVDLYTAWVRERSLKRDAADILRVAKSQSAFAYLRTYELPAVQSQHGPAPLPLRRGRRQAPVACHRRLSRYSISEPTAPPRIVARGCSTAAERS